MLAAALAADTGRGGSGAGPADIFSGMGLEFKEVCRLFKMPLLVDKFDARTP